MKTKSLFLIASIFSILAHAQSNFIGSGIALSFNGDDANSVSLGDVYNDLQFPFTIEAWIYLNQYPTNQTISTKIFASDNNTTAYCGFWFAVDSKEIPGQVRVEFGNAEGGGYQFREGMSTTSLVPLKKWIHVAAVCQSPIDIQIYFNGVAQPMEQTDGDASISSIIHSSDGASIGWQQTQFGSRSWNGQLDEIRLWNVARSETEIRDHMCQKLYRNETGLIGYWTADESYTSNTVLDYTSPAENGTIEGTVGKVTSGAAIGDMSTHVFTDSWKGVSLSLSSSGKDKFAVKAIKQNPYGVFIYRVDSAPYSTIDLNKYPPYYFGVFTADGANEAKYNVYYRYSFKNSVVDSENQSSCSLFKRTDDSDLVWTNATASLDTKSKQLSLIKESGRNEYIFNVSDSTFRQFAPEVLLLTAYPNPFSNQLNIASGISGKIFVLDALGKIVYHNAAAASDVTINTSTWSNGLYLVMLKNENQTYYRKVILNR